MGAVTEPIYPKAEGTDLQGLGKEHWTGDAARHVDRAQLRAAAQLRARYRVRTPDALQLAAALSHDCAAFLTNDRELPEVSGIRIVQLREHL